MTKLFNPDIKNYMRREKKFGDVLRELREKERYGIKKLAPTLGVSYTYLSKIENNKTTPSEEFIEKIAQHFGHNKEELMIIAGKIPEDIKRILRENPRTAIEYLRREFGGSTRK